MNSLHIHASRIQQMTSIPSLFFDVYMPEASGEFLKVYLYLYRQQSDSSRDLSLADIADRLYMTERDVTRALRYWQDRGLLTLASDAAGNLSAVTLLPVTAPEAAPVTNDAEPDRAAANDISPDYTVSNNLYPDHTASNPTGTDYTKPQYTMNQISDFSRNNQGEQLFFILQQYLGHPLSQTEINTIVFFHERLGFSTDLIEYLFEYCIDNNHRSIHYIEKVAISWAEAGIDTVSKAKGRSAYYSKTHYAVLRAFGISGRNPAKSETEYINRWTDVYGFSAPVIIEACNRTIAATHTPSFEYADKILKNWKEQKVTGLSDISILDENREKSKKTLAGKGFDGKGTDKKAGTDDANAARGRGSSRTSNRFNNFTQRTYDYGELEQKLARKLHGESTGVPEADS